MYPANFHYHRTTDFREASELLSRFGGDAKAIAGGQTLVPLLKLRLVTPQHLVDIGRIKGANSIERDGARLRVGALATHADIAAAQATRAIPMAAECSAGIADPQVRNRGTIGGSLAEADEQSLRGARLTDETIRSVATLAASATEPLADGRGSVEYKRFLAAGLVRRAIANAMARAQGRAAPNDSHSYYGR